MNKILFLLGMVFCLNAQSGVAIVDGDNPSGITQSTEERRRMILEDNNRIKQAKVIKLEKRYRTLATRGQCRALDGSGRQICEPGQIYEHTFLGYEVTYQFEGYVGTYFTEEHPGGYVFLQPSVTPIK
jgi:hypothetical protein